MAGLSLVVVVLGVVVLAVVVVFVVVVEVVMVVVVGGSENIKFEEREQRILLSIIDYTNIPDPELSGS